MPKFIKIVPFIAIIFLTPTFPVTAQDTAAPETLEAGSQPEEDLKLGEQVSPDDQIGKTYTREVHGDWQLRCVRTDDGRDPCQLYQLMRDDNGNSVAEITLFEFPKGQEANAGATVAVPLGALLTRQVTISVDSGSAKRYPFSWCSAQGCYARIGFTANDLGNLKRGANAYVTIVPFASPNTQVRLTLSLTGFTKGFAALQAANEATTSP